MKARVRKGEKEADRQTEWAFSEVKQREIEKASF